MSKMIYDELDELIDNLSKPIYVYRMARGHQDHKGNFTTKGAETRFYNARKEIYKLLRNYAS